jgi:YhcH/YjgK/YiaL family protein
MIIDSQKNIVQYKMMLPNLEAGLAAIKEKGASLEVGRYAFEGGFFIVQKGETKPLAEGLFETHEKYIDIQMMMAGAEYVAWAALEDLSVETPYQQDKDIAFFSGEASHHMLIGEGMFWAAFPKDAHMPIRHLEAMHRFTKIILKLPIEG